MLRTPVIVLALLSFSIRPAYGETETLECNSDDGVMHALTITLKDGKIASFEYLGSTPSVNGDTYFNCGFSSERNSKVDVWSDSGETTQILYKEGIGEDDKATIKKKKNTYEFTFDMALSNCGHSSVFAKSISLTKGKKSCHDIETK